MPLLKIPSANNLSLRIFFFGFCLILITLFSSCSNPADTNKQSVALAATLPESKPAAAPPAGDLTAASLFIDANTFLTLDDNGFNKLVFQMYHDRNNNSLRAAIVPARNGNSGYNNGRMKILERRIDLLSIEGMDVFLSDQQTQGNGANNDFKKLIQEIEANNANASKPKITFVIFDPVMDPANNRRFVYNMYGVTDATVTGPALQPALSIATGVFKTNPSPPATLD